MAKEFWFKRGGVGLQPTNWKGWMVIVAHLLAIFVYPVLSQVYHLFVFRLWIFFGLKTLIVSSLLILAYITAEDG